MSMERFCRKEVATIQSRDTVVRAARTMMEKHVGALVVVDEKRRPVGMITDRDITCRVVAAMHDPATTSVESAMSRDLVTVREDETIDGVAFSMRKHGVRRLPVVDAEGRLTGLVAFDDMVVLLSRELGETVATLQDNRGP
ncbi:MAG: CBS domain-containing protein [Myxococcales bacterium]|jgi:CBS domain-containing protein